MSALESYSKWDTLDSDISEDEKPRVPTTQVAKKASVSRKRKKSIVVDIVSDPN